MKRLDKTALLIITTCLIVLGGIILFGSHQPLQITCENGNNAEISHLGNVTFKFSRAVDQSKVAELWQVEPEITGRWEWKDDRHVTWFASTPLHVAQTFQMSFKAGELGKNGEQLKEEKSWQMKVRLPIILVLKAIEGPGQELYSINLEGNTEPQPFSHTGGNVFDYAPSPDGEQVAMAVRNNQNGIDLWIIKRNGSDQYKLLDCGNDRCTAANWSPVSHEIAYTRESSGLDPKGPKGAPRIWILDLDSGETAPLFSDSQKIGYGPLWSPDGKWLSIWNGVEGGIQIVNRQTGETSLLETESGDTGCWSSDSKTLYFTKLIIGESSFHNVVMKADIQAGTIQTALGGNIAGEGLSYDIPACHPSQHILAASTQPNIKVPGKFLSIFDLDSGATMPVMNDLTKIPGFYSWDPAGDYLLFQMSVVSKEKDDFGNLGVG